ncbi:MAG: serine protease [Oligoflexales bacterium]|nr:serine protease [Oligoflexales bacterium]
MNNFQIIKFSFLLFIFGCQGLESEQKNLSSPKVIGGTSTAVPSWMVSLGTEFGHECAGVLIEPQVVLTAAHCFSQTQSDWHAVIGENRSFQSNVNKAIAVKAIIIHPDYDFGKYLNDIALVFLSTPAKVSRHLLPKIVQAEVGQKALTYGWGNISNHGLVKSAELQKLEISILKTDECKKYGGLYSSELSLNGSQVCAANTLNWSKSTCQGDSGGPLVSSENPLQLIGILNWGVDCSGFEKPSIYISPIYFENWINSETQRYFAATIQTDLAFMVSSHCYKTISIQTELGKENDLAKGFTLEQFLSIDSTTKHVNSNPLIGLTTNLGECVFSDELANEVLVTLLQDSSANQAYEVKSAIHAPIWLHVRKSISLVAYCGFSYLLFDERDASYPNFLSLAQTQWQFEGEVSGPMPKETLCEIGENTIFLNSANPESEETLLVGLNAPSFQIKKIFKAKKKLPTEKIAVSINLQNNLMEITNETSRTLYTWELVCNSEFSLIYQNERKNSSLISGSDSEKKYSISFIYPDNNYAVIDAGQTFVFGIEIEQSSRCFLNSEYMASFF